MDRSGVMEDADEQAMFCPYTCCSPGPNVSIRWTKCINLMKLQMCWFANWSSSENTMWWTSELRKNPHVQKMRLWESGICYSLHRCLYLSIRDYDKVWPNMYLLVQARWNRSEHSSEHHKMRCWLQFKVNRRKCRSLEFVFEWNINVNKFHWS